MVVYYSATGNSKWIASLLSQKLDMPMVSMLEIMDSKDPQRYITDREKLIIVAPVHAWYPALFVKMFLLFLLVHEIFFRYAYMVFTCGDDCGEANKEATRLMNIIADKFCTAFSVQMPNTYILLPGFDVDDEKTRKKKLDAAPERVNQIAKCILDNTSDPQLYYAGHAAWFKSRVLHPMFRKFVMKRSKFYVTEACNGCGICQRICPIKIIQLNALRQPEWNKTCIQCLACLHHCPQQAIQWGNQTQKKGRYINPFVKT